MQDFRNLDARLLMVFQAVMNEGSVTAAARRLSVTQPAISNSLNRFRNLLSDPLFIRDDGQMRPTVRACEISDAVNAALRSMQFIAEGGEFDARSTEKHFRVAMSAHTSEIFVPRLIRHLQKNAPGVTLTVIPKSNFDVFHLLKRSEIDFAIGVFESIPDSFEAYHLFNEDYIGVRREDEREDISDLMEFVALRHIVINPTGHRDVHIDRYLKSKGIERNVVLTVNQTEVALEIISQSELVTAMFNRTLSATSREKRYPISTFPVPVPGVEVQLVTMPEFNQHPAYGWFRRLVQSLAMDLV